MPKMMLGTAANSSTATPMGRFNTAGKAPLGKSAIPNPTGTASAMAMAEVTMVRRSRTARRIAL